MITLSIDGSTKSTGVAVFEQGKLKYYQCIKASDSNTNKRIKKMINRIKQICEQYKPTDIVMEQILPEDVKYSQNTYKPLIYLQAAVVLGLDELDKKICLYTASHWRSVCGIRVGRGIKREELKKASQRLVQMIYNIQVNDDISDAICLGIAYIKQHRSAF